MSNVKFKVDMQGVRDFLHSDEVTSHCKQRAEQIQQRAGSGYIVEGRNYPRRAGSVVKAGTDEAYRDNLENNTLLKSLY